MKNLVGMILFFGMAIDVAIDVAKDRQEKHGSPIGKTTLACGQRFNTHLGVNQATHIQKTRWNIGTGIEVLSKLFSMNRR